MRRSSTSRPGVEKDTLPPRLLREHLPEGPAKGKVNDLYTMLAEYYRLEDGTQKAFRHQIKKGIRIIERNHES